MISHNVPVENGVSNPDVGVVKGRVLEPLNPSTFYRTEAIPAVVRLPTRPRKYVYTRYINATTIQNQDVKWLSKESDTIAFISSGGFIL